MADEKKGFLDKIKDAASGEIKRALGLGDPLPHGMPRGPRRPAAGAGMNTDRLQRPAVPTGRLSKGAAPTAELQGPTQEELSPRRLAMIEDFVQGRIKIARMNDPTFMYKVVADERAYQTGQLKELKGKLNALSNMHGPEAQAIEAQIRKTSMIIQNLFRVLKMITGKQGTTGGTDFLS